MAAPMAAAPAAAPAPAPAVAATPLFALLIPGRTLMTNFTQVDAKKMLIQVPAPAQITEINVCMLQPSIPADHAVAVHYALPGSELVDRRVVAAAQTTSQALDRFDGSRKCLYCCCSFCSCLLDSWQYLGSISLQCPSASFRAVWRDKIPADMPFIGIGLSVESLATIAQMPPADAREEENTLDSAKGIAKNLYEFMASYSQNTGSDT